MLILLYPHLHENTLVAVLPLQLFQDEELAEQGAQRHADLRLMGCEMQIERGVKM